MIFKISKDIRFTNFYKKLNILSLILIIFSLFILIFKGLNLGVDFKGGTLIEIRTETSTVNIAEIRQSFLKMNLGDVTVKKFGKENDYLVKIESTRSDDNNFIKSINDISTPYFLAIPTDIILADEPIIVIFPPKQAPRARAHQRILLGMGLLSSISWIMGIMVMVKGMLSRNPEAIPETHKTINTIT